MKNRLPELNISHMRLFILKVFLTLSVFCAAVLLNASQSDVKASSHSCNQVRFTISGKITIDGSGAPVANKRVAISGITNFEDGYTDSNGNYSITFVDKKCTEDNGAYVYNWSFSYYVTGHSCGGHEGFAIHDSSIPGYVRGSNTVYNHSVTNNESVPACTSSQNTPTPTKPATSTPTNPPSTNAKIEACVRWDSNNNGIVDSLDYYVGNNSIDIIRLSDNTDLFNGATSSLGASCGCMGLTVYNNGGYRVQRALQGLTNKSTNPVTVNVSSNTTYSVNFLTGGTFPTGSGLNPTICGGWTGFVFVDKNNNGVYDTGDTGYNGAAVSLTGPVNRSTTTSNSPLGAGGYVMIAQPTGTYILQLTVPSGYRMWSNSSGVSAQSSVTRTQSFQNQGFKHNFAIVPNATNTTTPPPPTSTVTSSPTPPDNNTGEISGNVYDICTGGSLAGATMRLYEQTDTGLSFIASKTTDASGNYQYDSLAIQEQYRIELYNKGSGRSTWEIVQPSNGNNYYNNTSVGSTRNFALQGPSCTTPTPSVSATPSVTGTLTPTTTITGSRVISGKIYEDNPPYGEYSSATDPVYSGTATITVRRISDGFSRNIQSTNGTYSISALPNGIYTVTISALPADTVVSSTNPLTVDVRFGNKLDQDFLVRSGVEGEDFTISGRVFKDVNNNTCTSGSTVLPNVRLQLFTSSGSEVGSQVTSNALGNYVISGKTDATDHSISVSLASHQLIGARKSDTGNFLSIPAGGSYSPVTIPPTSQTVHFCMREITVSDLSWFMAVRGSVRQGQINNPVPVGKNPSTTGRDASVFYSTQGSALLGDARSSTKWIVDREFQHNSPALNSGGNTSYSFYLARAQQNGVTLAKVPGCAYLGDGFDNCTIHNLGTLSAESAKIFYVNGNVTLNASTIPGVRRYVLLASGDIIINGNIDVTDPSGLLILAAKRNIIVRNSVGTDADNSSTFQIDGILTAEDDIVIEGNKACPVADKRLNINGSLVANSDHPFGVDPDPAAGKLLINRSLCEDNNDYPTLYVISRLNFITQLTDFYKVSSRIWREVEP